MNTLIVDAVLILLVFLSIATWTIAILKIRQFKAMFSNSQVFQAAFWNAKDWAAGEKVVESDSSDLAAIAKVGFQELNEFNKSPNSLKYAGDIHEVLERPMRQEIQKILRLRERGLAELASIGSISPFVGLFGTVWGIINSFTAIAHTNNTSLAVVAPGIAEALFATAIGLFAAIPAVIAYNWLQARAGKQQARLEAFADDWATFFMVKSGLHPQAFSHLDSLVLISGLQALAEPLFDAIYLVMDLPFFAVLTPYQAYLFWANNYGIRGWIAHMWILRVSRVKSDLKICVIYV